jgi:ABC-type multidrug transport system ATPase subunit
MDSTKILVLNRGELAEYGKPIELLENQSGIFTSMVDATGAEQSTFLKKIASGEIGVIQSLKSIHESSFEDYENSAKEVIEGLKNN